MEVKASNLPSSRADSKLFSKDKKLEKFVVALFDYDPKRDSHLPVKGLSFAFGDILHVTNASDPQWWYAKHVFSINHVIENESPVITKCTSDCSGIIPSSKLVKKRDRLKNRKVNFRSKNLVIGDEKIETEVPIEGPQNDPIIRYSSPREDKPKKTSLFSRYFSSRSKSLRSKEYSSSAESINKNLTFVFNGSDVVGLPNDSLNRSYIEVEKLETNQASRPIVILGPMSDVLIDDLLQIDQAFVRCPLSTTKHIENESEQLIRIDGDITAMQLNGGFIEMMDHEGEFYGLHSSTITSALAQEKIPVLRLSMSGVKRLKSVFNSLIVILPIPDSEDVILSLDPDVDQVLLRKKLAECDQIYENERDHLTCAFKFKSYEACTSKLKYILSFYLKPNVWIPKRKRNQLEKIGSANQATK